jgi:hypothetical protein
MPLGSPARPLISAPPLNVEIVNGRTNTPPKDGKVEMLLSVLARDSDGKPINIASVKGWEINGTIQLDADGHAVTSNGLPVHLPEGSYAVSVTGSTTDGRLVSGQANVSVNIAVREESTVRLKQLPKPAEDPASPPSEP